MKTQELIRSLALRSGVSQATVRSVLSSYAELVMEMAPQGEAIPLPRLGVWHLVMSRRGTGPLRSGPASYMRVRFNMSRSASISMRREAPQELA